MDDEYRFRAWHYPSKRMVYMSWRDERAAYMFDVQVKRMQREYSLSQMLTNPDFKPMLAVVCTDKNNKPMYEGDLVRRWKHGQELPMTTVQRAPGFWWDNYEVSEYEVVGNVFEGIKNGK